MGLVNCHVRFLPDTRQYRRANCHSYSELNNGVCDAQKPAQSDVRLPPKATAIAFFGNVCFGPIADIAALTNQLFHLRVRAIRAASLDRDAQLS